MQVDVVIVGAGLVGSVLACSLAQLQPNLSMLLIEANAHAPTFDESSYDPRVVALNLSSIRLLEDIEVWADIEPLVSEYQHMRVWDGEGNGSIGFDHSDLGEQKLGCIVESSLLLSRLRDRIAEHRNIQVLFPAEIAELQFGEDSQNLVLVDGQTVNAQLIVAADGGRSRLRAMASLETREWDYGHDAIVTTIETEFPHQATAWQCFKTDGPLAYLPLRDAYEGEPQRYSSIVWSLNRDVAAEKMLLSDEDFRASVAHALEYKLGEVLWCDKRYSLPLRQRHAKEYGKAGFVLVGDSAHSIHPLAGQGVNLGFADAMVLGDEVVRALKRSVRLSDASIVKRYQRVRKPQNLLAMATMEGFKRLFERSELPLMSLRNRGMDWVDQQVLLKRFFARYAA